ncbi:MAG: hypothetical protein ACR2J5_06180 [Geodermatophilaceae bacterium]
MMNADLVAEDTARAVAERAESSAGRLEPTRQATGPSGHEKSGMVVR